MNTAAMTGNKEEHERGVKLLRDFHQMLQGESPEFDTPERLRERWGTTGEAQAGQAALLSTTGVVGFVLDDDDQDEPDDPEGAQPPGPIVE